MATEPTPQRSYRAACPNCGAPVEFRSPASASAVCSYCRSSVVRDGDTLRRIGQSAELFDDHTPLQLGSAGRHQGAAFTLIGRLQYRSESGTWNEWHALFDTGRSGWLSEDNGHYVIAFDRPAQSPLPAAVTLQPGQLLNLDGERWSVASVTSARLIAAAGELPSPPLLDRAFELADLRNPRDEVATIDYSLPAQPRWSIGRPVALSELALTGLTEPAEKTLSARGLSCPNCGAALEIKLASTKSVVCGQCHAVVDVSQGGAAGELTHYLQAGDHAEAQIPLGSVGTLALGGRQALPWQVVGYVERCEVARPDAGDDDEGDPQSFWREYLLYHRSEGFGFLVDAEDGWSWVAPITGVPERAGAAVKYGGTLYVKLYDYVGRVTYVLGEFYWPLSRDQLTDNTDYRGSGAATSKRLNRELTGSGGAQEIVWSAGETLAADTVVQAFRLAPEAGAALQRDALPTALQAGTKLRQMLIWGFVILVMLVLWRCDSRDDCDALRSSYGEASQEYRSCASHRGSGGAFRTGGGAFGGYSSGGSHK